MPSVWYWLLLAGLIVLIPTAYAGKIGAPWVPTRRRAVTAAFEAVDLGSEDTVVDLGAGDGKVLVAALEKGASAIGFELSPIMWAVAKLRTLGRARVSWKNFYKQSLPKDTTIVFAFLLPETMPRLRQYLQQQSTPNLKYVLSYAFPFRDVASVRTLKEPQCATIYVYTAQSLTT